LIRKLGIFEKAAVVSNDYAPFNVVIVLKLGNAPDPEILQAALNQLQSKHQILRAKISEKNNKLWFEVDDQKNQIPLKIIPWDKINTWKSVAEKEMAHSFNKKMPPLIRATYLRRGKDGDLFLTAHHSIMDGTFGIQLAEELISFCAGFQSEPDNNNIAINPEKILPPSHVGLNKFKNLIRFGVSQFIDEISFWWKNFGKRKPQVHAEGRGKILSLILAEEFVDELAKICRIKGITINSVLNTAQLLAVNRILYKSEQTRMATYSFADLRPYLEPPLSKAQMGSWVTLIRLMIDVHGEQEFWSLAKNLHQQLYRSINQGDKFNSFLTSEALLKVMTGLKSIRFGSSAVNYSGVIPLRNQYGSIKLLGVHGLVSVFDLAPEFSSQARIFNNMLTWDFIYLDSDMDKTTASSILDEIQLILSNAVNHD